VDVRPNEEEIGVRRLEPGVLEAARVEVLDVLEERSTGGSGSSSGGSRACSGWGRR